MKKPVSTRTKRTPVQSNLAAFLGHVVDEATGTFDEAKLDEVLSLIYSAGPVSEAVSSGTLTAAVGKRVPRFDTTIVHRLITGAV
jgi:hypothetical protein